MFFKLDNVSEKKYRDNFRLSRYIEKFDIFLTISIRYDISISSSIYRNFDISSHHYSVGHRDGNKPAAEHLLTMRYVRIRVPRSFHSTQRGRSMDSFRSMATEFNDSNVRIKISSGQHASTITNSSNMCSSPCRVADT
jgi:hypothetical protein